jgi:hypothetical protein
MFKITRGKGFHMTFDNGWTVCVQWGTGNYGDHYWVVDSSTDEEVGAQGSATAEVAAWDKDRNWYKVNEASDTVRGYVSTDEVLAFMTKIAAL